MKWKEVKNEIKEKLDIIENKINNNNYDVEEIKKELKTLYTELIKMNNFITFADNKIKNLAKEIKNKNNTGGLHSFVQSMRIAPVDLTTFIDKGWNFMVEEQYDDAIGVLEKAYKLAPNDIKTMNLLGWAYIHKEEFDKAMGIFQKVLNKDNNNQLAKINLGFVCFKKGIYGEAIEHLSSIIKKSSDTMSLIYANFYLGLIYFEREMYEDALRFFNKTIEIAPNHMEAYYYKGLTYFNMELINKAKEVFKGLIAKNKYNKWAQRAEEKLKEINGDKNEEENKS